MTESQLKKLLEEMTIEEKFGQLTQSTAEHFIFKSDGNISSEIIETGPTSESLGLTENNVFTIGSVLGVSSAKAINLIQKNYLAKNRLGIPLLFMHDAIHGYKTIFPIPLALSCSWDTQLVEKVAGYIASELRATGIHVNFSPMVDLVRDARWGRVMESFGEDHILSGDFGNAMVRGYQKTDTDIIPSNGVASCVKHFACYGACESGVDYAQVDLSMKEFYGYYLKPYEISLKSKPRFVMSSFNSINGEPVTSSQFLLKDTLRDELGYEGIVISDWRAVEELLQHGVCEDIYSCGELAFNAGVDVEMCSTSYLHNGKDFVTKSEELLNQLNKAVYKILKLKNDLGLFENPYVNEQKETENILTMKAKSVAKDSAVDSCVLLKNNNSTLPFSNHCKNIVIVGKYASTQELLGNWACKGSFEDVISLETGIKNLNPNAKVTVFNTFDESNLSIIENADVVIVTVGESWELSGEGHSSAIIDISQFEQDLVEKVWNINKKLSVVVFSGRPLALSSIDKFTNSILWCWYLGTMAGQAIAELLFGYSCPSGRLTMSFPRVSGQTPLRYNYIKSGRPANLSTYSSRYQDCEIGPLYKFGHGLSYANIEYSNFKISDTKITQEKNITISFDIENKSDFPCKEIAILFFDDPVAKIVRPVKELVKYKKVCLKANEKTVVNFDINLENLKYSTHNNERLIEKGTINFYLNTNEEKIFDILVC